MLCRLLVAFATLLDSPLALSGPLIDRRDQPLPRLALELERLRVELAKAWRGGRAAGARPGAAWFAALEVAVDRIAACFRGRKVRSALCVESAPPSTEARLGGEGARVRVPPQPRLDYATVVHRVAPRRMNPRHAPSLKGSPRVFDIEMVQDRADKWRFSVNGFDNDCSAGRNLNSDLRKLRGQSCIKMEITFPSDYPTRPFFLRCVSPRFCWYTGHVTAGGAICIEALTTSGSPGSWNPSLNVEAILHTVFANFLDTTSQVIRTATGPGGVSGPLRVDLQRRYCRDPLQEYTGHGARSAFDRMLRHHAANGW